jgi:autotransporter-associated beta strand protein
MIRGGKSLCGQSAPAVARACGGPSQFLRGNKNIMVTRTRSIASLWFRQILVCCVQAAVVVMAVASTASAADYTLTGGANGQPASDATFGSSISASSAVWVPSDYSSLTRVAWPNTTSDTMVFGVGTGTAGDVQTTGTFNLNGMRFQTTGSGTYRILLNVTTLALGGTDPTITVNSGVTARLANNGGGGSTGLLTAPSGSTVRFTGGGTLYMDSMSEFNNAGTGGGFTSLGRGNSNRNNTYAVVQDGNTTVRYTGSGGGIALSTDGSGNANIGTGTTTYTLKSGVLRHDDTGGQSFLVIGRNWKADFVQEGGEVILLNTGNAVFIGDRGAGSYTISGGTLSAVTSGAIFQMSFRSASASSLSISGSGSFRTNGTGNLAVTSGATSTVAISGGELAVNALAKGAGTVSFSFSGGTLRPYAANATFGSTTAGNNFTISLSGTGATFSGSDGATGFARTATVEALLSGTGRVNINGGTVVFGNASNSYSGATVIAGGSLRLDADASFASSTSIVVGSTGSSGATLDLTSKASAFAFGSGQTVGGIGSVLMPTNGVSLAGFLAPGDGGIGTLTFTNARTLDLEPAIDAGSNRFLFDLGAGDVSDLVSLSTGTLNIGSGKLQFSDFAFSLSPLSQGTYRLFSASTISGTLTSDTAARKGTITGAYTGELVQGAGYIDLVVVPEPGAVALVGIGLGFGVVCLRRSRRK